MPIPSDASTANIDSETDDPRLWRADGLDLTQKFNSLLALLRGDAGDVKVIAAGTATARALSDRFADMINVKDYGAVGDGVTDDTSAIQAAIDANPGRTIHLLDGTYLVSSTIRISSGYTSLVGAGPGATTIKRSSDYGDTILIQGTAPNAIQGVEIRGINIWATTRPTTGSHISVMRGYRIYLAEISMGDGHRGISLAGCYAAHLEDIQMRWSKGNPTNRRGIIVTPAGSAFESVLGANIAIVNCDVASAWVQGDVEMPGMDFCLDVSAVDGLWISNSYFGSAQQATVRLHNDDAAPGAFLTGVKLSNCWLDHGTGLAFQTVGTTAGNFSAINLQGCRIFGGAAATGGVQLQGNVKGVQIVGCTMDYATDDLIGIALQGDGAQVNITGCILNRADSDGTGGGDVIAIYSGSQITISGCSIDGKGVSDRAFYVEGGSKITITGNGAVGCANSVGIQPAATEYILTNNNFRGCTSTAIADFGTAPKLVASNLT